MFHIKSLLKKKKNNVSEQSSVEYKRQEYILVVKYLQIIRKLYYKIAFYNNYLTTDSIKILRRKW